MQDGLKLIDLDAATRLVRRAVDPTLTVTAMRPLAGGMIHQVCLLQTDGQPASIVIKLGTVEQQESLQRQRAVLDWYRLHANIPVPRVYSVVQPLEGFVGSALLMEHLPGVNLSDARLSATGKRRVQRELAHYVVALHAHVGSRFGSAMDAEAGFDTWVQMFRPMLEHNYQQVMYQLSTRTRSIVFDLIDRLERYFHPAGVTPALCHGDLWATNILVDDQHPDRPRIVGFVDCSANYCDPEYELSYLQLFHTADEEFFRLYHRAYPRRLGYEKRYRIYWLNTMLLHLHLFGDQYRRTCDELAQQVSQMG